MALRGRAPERMGANHAPPPLVGEPGELQRANRRHYSGRNRRAIAAARSPPDGPAALPPGVAGRLFALALPAVLDLSSDRFFGLGIDERGSYHSGPRPLSPVAQPR